MHPDVVPLEVVPVDLLLRLLCLLRGEKLDQAPVLDDAVPHGDLHKRREVAIEFLHFFFLF